MNKFVYMIKRKLANHQDTQELAACAFLGCFSETFISPQRERKILNDHIAKNKRRLGAFSVYSEDDFSICMPHVSCSATKLNH